MAIYKEHYITVDTKRTNRIALQNIVTGETGNRIHVTVTNDGSPLTLTASKRVILKISSNIGQNTQDSDENEGITFDNGNAIIVLDPECYASNLNRCRLDIYDGNTYVSTAEFQFTAFDGGENEQT